ncbi:MAG: hypothetical protein M3362_22495 [Acidobacteriota bacterium]|nr:hypothetical protein [Acidobacteriota bacterium]
MRSIDLKGAIGKVLLGFFLLFGIGIMSSTRVQAQWQDNRDRYDRRDRDRDRDYDRDQNRDWQRDRNGRWNRRGRNNDGYGNYGGSYELRQTALNAGYNEGQKAGRDDGRSRRRYDPSSKSEYRKASKDYNSRLGDRYTYQQYFREAFEHGYSDGYNGY